MKMLKGDEFINRYRFTGTLRTRSSLHIGSGISNNEDYRKKKSIQANASPKNEKSEKVPEVSTIVKDYRGKPLIPGSSLRGVIRHWLFSIFLSGFGDEWACIRNYQDPKLTQLSQAKQVEEIKNNFSWLELIFGTPFHEGKIEIWDAACITNDLPAPDSLMGWDSKSLTYIDTSVAINPATGTAADELLYNVEVVPPGVEFEFNLVGQNLSDLEIGLILLALQGFNSTIYPILVGARNGRGYGQIQFIPGPIYGLKSDDLRDWIISTLQGLDNDWSPEHDGHSAGYFALPKLSVSDQKILINTAKQHLMADLEE